MSPSYAQALGTNSKPPNNNTNRTKHTDQPHPRPSPQKPCARSKSPGRENNTTDPNPVYVAKTSLPKSGSYVLTFLTSKPHHDALTSLRTKYFPPKLNHLSAHLTLFHALPGSKLDSAIIPTLTHTASSTSKFHLLASTPFKLTRGIAIGIPKSAGGDTARAIHTGLKREWSSFLSDQDAGGFAPHYTIMNKVSDEKEVQRAFEEVTSEFRAVGGTVEGLSLWLYVGPGWEWKRDFEFQG